MTSLGHLLVVVAGTVCLTCYEGKQLTATDTEQSIETYGYSSGMTYSSYMFETWSIETEDPMNTIEVEIEMDIEPCLDCHCDSLQIYDGPNTATSSLGKFCGASTGKIISSSGRDMHVVFKSDYIIENRGFRLKYKQVQQKRAIWVIVGVVLTVVIIIASICLILCVCCKFNQKNDVVHIRLNYQLQHQPHVWMTRGTHQHVQVVPAQFPPPPPYQEFQQQNTQIPDITDRDSEDLPRAFDVVGVGSRPPRQDQKM